MSQAPEGGYGTPKFGRIEIRMADKDGLRYSADRLRELCDNLDQLASGSLDAETANYVAWAAIKSTSQKLRKGKEK